MIRSYRVQTRRSGEIRISQRTRHGTILELSETIRGYRNRHYRAARRTIERNWDRITTRAADDTARRAAARARQRAARAARQS